MRLNNQHLAKPALVRQRSQTAFSLIEMLVVIVIIGIMAGLAAPVLRNLNKADTVQAASRQLMDDFNLARSLALSSRSTVYVVFVPPNPSAFSIFTANAADAAQLNNLIGGQYISYALYAERTVGDQPGTKTPRFLTDWKTLPEKTWIDTNEFYYGELTNTINVPFPNAKSGATAPLPYIGFNSQGQLLSIGGVNQDAVISFTSGKIQFNRDATTGIYSNTLPDLVEIPTGFSTNNAVRINWLTGRAVLQRVELGNITSGVGVGPK